ncbi:MAG: response regulator [Candidatus Kapabacteria bacterium]|jgi:Fe-S oxidoreductase|nr:response regulator [Candidatus Kapabacteria bacterium]
MKERSYKADLFLKNMKKKLNRQIVGSLVACVHCGMCTDSCHYALANPGDPTYAPAYKGDRMRKIFKRHFDWTGRVVPWWVGAKSVITDEDLEEVKDIAFGKCTNCRRCTINCPMGVDFATFNRSMRGLLVSVGVMPEGVAVVSKDQWEIGNQMGVLPEDYIDTLEWMSEDMQADLDDETAVIPIDKQDADIVYTINPREVKYDPRTISDAGKIFHLAGANWTMPSEGWDMTNFGLFSGDDALGGAVAVRVYDKLKELNGGKLVISECGHGYRSTRCEGPNWAGRDQDFIMESSVTTMLNYIKEGKIKVDKSKNPGKFTFHDSCNNARSCGLFEEPRELLRLVVDDFVEMYPNRTENFCCTGGGGAMSMSEYTPDRLKSAVVKADQLKATGATTVVTSCHNCVDGLSDCIKHYKLGMDVTQLVNLVANALVIPEKPKAEKEAPAAVAKDTSQLLKGRKILVVDDEPDILIFFKSVLEDIGATVFEASNGEDAIAIAKREKPDLMTLDINMPGKDGGWVFEKLRNDPEIAQTKVCIVTGRPELRRLIYDRPVPPPEGYLDKPVDERTLIMNARKIIEVG